MKQLKTKNMEKCVLRHAQCGGPCSGKTTGLAHEIEFAKSLGLNVLVVPEAATFLFGSGIPRDKNTQKRILHHQITMENYFYDIGVELFRENGKKTLIIHDRSMLDGLAYVEEEKDFLVLLKETGFSLDYVKQNRYDVVTHLVTSAYGAVEFYTTENNKERTESVEEAIALDNKLQNIWLGHDHYEIIGNRNNRDDTQKSFDDKIRENTSAVFQALGFPTPVEKERTWKVGLSWNEELFYKMNIKLNSCDYIQTYLVPKNNKSEERVRMKVFLDGSVFFFNTEKQEIRPGESIEKEAMINQASYHRLLSRRDLDREIIRKKRYSFIWKEQVFTLDRYSSPEKDYSKLELEGSRIDHVDLPDFLPVLEEVTNKPGYRDRDVALVK